MLLSLLESISKATSTDNQKPSNIKITVVHCCYYNSIVPLPALSLNQLILFGVYFFAMSNVQSYTLADFSSLDPATKPILFFLKKKKFILWKSCL